MDHHEERVLLVLFIAVAMLILLIDPETGLGKVPASENFMTGAAVGVSPKVVPFISNPIVLFFGILLLIFLAMEFWVQQEFNHSHQVTHLTPKPFRSLGFFESDSKPQKSTSSRQSTKSHSKDFSLKEEWDWIHQELEKIKKEF